MINEKSTRLKKAFGLALGVHVTAAAILGAYFWTPLFNQDNKILEVALAGPPPKKKVVKQTVKPKAIIKPKADDIVDKRLKPPEPVPQQEVKEEVEEQEEGVGNNVTQTTEQPPQAVTLPYITYNTIPPYPNEARKNGIEGTVRIRVLIDVNGKVSEASISSSSGSSLLDQAALQAVHKWRFSPAKDATGKKVKCYVTVPIVYKIKK